MPATGGRRGRRDNGLVAAEYDVAGDVDPRVGEHLLDVLAAGGIAAYLQPTTDLHPITRTTSLPARPTDRLFVDRAHLSTARDYLDQVASDEPAPPSKAPDAAGAADEAAAFERAWREIVAGYSAPVDRADPPWPAAEEIRPSEPDPDPDADGAADDGAQADGPDEAALRQIILGDPRPLPKIEEGQPERAEPSLLDALDTFGASLPDEDDEGYTPPPPPPLPRISAPAVFGSLAIAFGLVLFVWPAVLPMDRNTVLLIGFGAAVAGFATLIWRLRPGDDDDDFDDGARV